MTESLVVHRLQLCAGRGCRRLFAVCRSCGWTRRYCSAECRDGARRMCVREAGRRYQQTDEGRSAHAALSAKVIETVEAPEFTEQGDASIHVWWHYPRPDPQLRRPRFLRGPSAVFSRPSTSARSSRRPLPARSLARRAPCFAARGSIARTCLIGGARATPASSTPASRAAPRPVYPTLETRRSWTSNATFGDREPAPIGQRRLSNSKKNSRSC